MPERLCRSRSLLLFLPFLFIFSLPAGTLADVVLNEVLADAASDWSGDGAVDFKNDEWVEIINRGNAAEDLSNYWLSDAVLEPVVRYRFSGTLAAGQALHITGAVAVAWQAENGAGSSGLSLNNSEGEVALFRDYPSETQLADSVSYLGYQVEDDRSLGRFPMQGEDWILFDGMHLYHGNQIPGSTGCMPSPGQPNTCDDAAPARSTSFSGVKRSFSKDH